MTLKSLSFALLITGTCIATTIGTASAFCGVMEETKSGRTAEAAIRKAENALKKKFNPLKREHGSKLVKDPVQKSCIGGAVSINSKGKQIEGNPSCTLTQPFCVNP